MLDLHRPEFAQLSSSSQNMIDWSDDLREDAIASSELRTQVVLASQIGESIHSADIIVRRLGNFTVNLRTAAEGMRDVGIELNRFLSKCVFFLLHQRDE